MRAWTYGGGAGEAPGRVQDRAELPPAVMIVEGRPVRSVARACLGELLDRGWEPIARANRPMTDEQLRNLAAMFVSAPPGGEPYRVQALKLADLFRQVGHL